MKKFMAGILSLVCVTCVFSGLPPLESRTQDLVFGVNAAITSMALWSGAHRSIQHFLKTS
jgi:hypothetical protein